MRSPALPSHIGGIVPRLPRPPSTSETRPLSRAGSDPTTVLVPRRTVTGRSVFSRYRQARHAEVGGLLLHAARIGDDHCGVALQAEELQVGQRASQEQAGKLQLMVLHPRPCARVHGKDHRNLRRHVAERVEDPFQRRFVVHVGRRVQGDERVRLRAAAVHEPEHLQNRVRPRARQQPGQRVDHDVANARDRRLPGAFGEQVLVGVGRWREVPGRQAVSDDTVDVVRRAAMVRSKPGLDVADRNASLRGRERRRHRRVRVAVDERRVGPELAEAALHADEDLGGLLRLRA